MIVIISPAKTLNYKTPSPTKKYSLPIFVKKANTLINILKKHSPTDLSELMKISSGLGELNYLRFQKWETGHNPANGKQALFTFNGEVYNGLNAGELNKDAIQFAQQHLRIISGLYGILNPLDLIQPYRLEMGTKLNIEGHKNLYSFWGDRINLTLNQELKSQNSPYLINLASREYSKSAKLDKIQAKVITPVFKELKNDTYKVITVYAKKARGLMARFIVENKIDSVEDLKHFDMEGYHYDENLSGGTEWVYTR